MRHFCTPRFASLAVAGLALFLASALFVLPSAFAAQTQALARKTKTKTKTKTTLVPGNTIHVPADQPTIQAGINAASNGDTVLVSPGTFTENIDFMGKQITLTSVSGPAVTIIDGGGYNSNVGATVNFSTNETASSILSGFTIQDGAISGISISGASPTIQGNVIQGSSILGNCLNNGYCEDGIDVSQNAGPLIQGNLIVINGQEGISTGGDNGTQIVGNVIAYSGDDGLLLGFYGSSNGPQLIQQNSIMENVNGGIYYASSSGSVSIIQNLVIANQGPGVQLQYSNIASLISNTIASNSPGPPNYGNLASEFIGGINNQVTIQNNLIAADQNLPAFDCYYVPPAAAWTNNDVYAANNTAYTGGCTDPTGTNGNISADPQFVDLLTSNFHIQSTSPAIKAGTISAPNEPSQDFDGDAREVNSTIDIGADEYTTPTALTISSNFLRFASQGVGTISTPQIVTLTNNASSAFTINLIATGQNFTQTNNCGTSLAGQSNCQISVSFAPIFGGSLTSVLGIFTSATANPQAIGLAGNGIPASISINPYGLQWYNMIIGTASTQTMTITNPGSIPLSISSIVYTGAADFVETNNCPLAPNTLSQGAFCTVTVTYTPTVYGYESGYVLVTDNADGQDSLYVYGNAYSAGIATLSPSTLTFPATVIGLSSAPQTVTLSNTGTGTLGKITFGNYSDFPITNNNCPTSLAPGASCTFNVTFVPYAQGSVTGYVYVYDDASQYSTSVTATGSGTAAVPTITSLSFSSAPSGSPDTQIIINGTGFLYGYNNTGTQALWNGIAISGYQYVSGTTQIYFTIPAYLLTTDGVNQITVTTPAPGGGTSNSMPFTVYTPLNYVAKTSTYTYTTITGTNLNLVWTYGGASAQITSPFPIQFGGGSYTTLTVGSSGTISFSAYTSEWNAPIPYSYVPTLIAPFWDQLYPFGTGTDNNVFWEVLGTAPNRQLVVEWRDVGYCCESTNTIKFQVVFLEGSGNFYFNYANTNFGKTYHANYGGTASVGEQVSAILGTQFSYYKPLLKSKSSILWQPSNPSATLSTSTVGFGYQQIGGPATPQSFTLTNGGPQSLSITSVTVSNPDFTQSNNCPATLTLGKNCKFTVTFKPSLPSAETATLTITDNATNSPQIVTMTGIGTVTSTLVYPGLVNFGSVKVGTTSTLPVILANASNKAMTIQSITVTPSAYTVSSNCGTSLAPSLSCTVNVTFAPTSTGSVSGSLSMGLNGAKSKAESKLSGSGS